MSKNTLLEENLAAHEALEKKYATLKWEFERFKEDSKKPPVKMGKKHKVAIQILKENGLFQNYLNRTRG